MVHVPNPEHWIVAMWLAAILAAGLGVAFLVAGMTDEALFCGALAALALFCRRFAPFFDRWDDRR